MDKIIILYSILTGEPLAAYQGDSALRTCVADMVTYEQEVACSSPASELRPYLGLGMPVSPRPKPRPEAF